MEKENLIVFSVVPSHVRNAVAIVSYGIVTGEEAEERAVGVLCRLADVKWNADASVYFRKVTLEEVPVELHYRPGELPGAFASWLRAGCILKDISQYDASFERFWNVYGKKMGNKPRVAKKWGKLDWEDRVLAIGSIPRLKAYYARHGFEMPYPETYVDQRRWENVVD